jgi:5-methylthioadenosine/S-adenosylhomocysteine deaminase
MSAGGAGSDRITLITASVLVTLDAQRRIITDGALAIRGDRIIALGKSPELQGRFTAAQIVDGSRFVVTPGFVDAHIHITGDPLTRGYIPDDIDAGFEDKHALGPATLPLADPRG